MSMTYSTPEVANLLGVHRATIARHVREGSAEHLHPITVGRVIRFPKAVIDRLVGRDETR